MFDIDFEGGVLALLVILVIGQFQIIRILTTKLDVMNRQLLDIREK
ncbi:hypothetical protein N9N99_02360 [Gammaproteobacteria bacterium]|nr:hypothetical protein [Gammaproteobacteria bacterium]